MNKFIVLTIFLIFSCLAQDKDLDLLDASDLEILQKELDRQDQDNIDDLDSDLSLGKDFDDLMGDDDLQQLRSDVDDFEILENEQKETGSKRRTPEKPGYLADPSQKSKRKDIKSNQIVSPNDVEIVSDPGALGLKSDQIFDVGAAEKELLEMAKKFEGRIPDDEWNEIALASPTRSYTVVEGDWLFKISQRLFGSGFYYAKIWSLNPYITNPHQIEPGMVLVFDTGSTQGPPEIRVRGDNDLAVKSSMAESNWEKQKKKLVEQGVYVHNASQSTIESLKTFNNKLINDEYKKYQPQKPEYDLQLPSQYDEDGFDRTSVITFATKKGYYLNTFVSNNLVQDFGEVTDSIEEGLFLSRENYLYIKFNEDINVVAGEKFSIYTLHGKVKHANSDRSGRKYSIVAHIQTVKEVAGKWECIIIESAGIAQRGDRVTIHTPKIDDIPKNFNPRKIEAAIVDSHAAFRSVLTLGDVVYLDRGRADGVAIGNIFQVYGFKDLGAKRKITSFPTYENGELTVISLTDNFATAIVTQARRDFTIGDIAISKSKEEAAKAMWQKTAANDKSIDSSGLDELDVELNINDINRSILDKADQIRMTEDELAELERQERSKSILDNKDKDLRALEQIENDIQAAEDLLNEASVENDELLEGENLEKIERAHRYQGEQDLEELEDQFGKKFIDDELRKVENPYGLTPFDVEEIDELLNIEQTQNVESENGQIKTR